MFEELINGSENRKASTTMVFVRLLSILTKDDRIKNSGQLLGFSFFGEEWTLEQDFYSWIYLIALSQNIKISGELLKFDAFTDIEFNMEKSFNCQAYSAALYVSLIKYKKLDLTQIQLPLEFKKNTPKKFAKNIQNELF